MTVEALLRMHGLEPSEVLALEVGASDRARVPHGARGVATGHLESGCLTIELFLTPRRFTDAESDR